jgi:hypothetical protein
MPKFPPLLRLNLRPNLFVKNRRAPRDGHAHLRPVVKASADEVGDVVVDEGAVDGVVSKRSPKRSLRPL